MGAVIIKITGYVDVAEKVQAPLLGELPLYQSCIVLTTYDLVRDFNASTSVYADAYRRILDAHVARFEELAVTARLRVQFDVMRHGP